MRAILNRILNSEFLTFNEVLRLKVAIVTIFVITFLGLSMTTSTLNTFTLDINIIVPSFIALAILLTILLTIVNLSRIAMHFSIYTIIGITGFIVIGSHDFFGFIMFFVTLTVIIFYQDILTYLLYGGAVTVAGTYYILYYGSSLIGTNSIDPQVSQMTYIIVLIGFYIIFLIQFVVSDNIYEKMNNEWVRMNKTLAKYQDFTLHHLLEMVEKNGVEPLYRNVKFQQTVSELSVFINEFFEEEGNNIAEYVEYYFFLHDQDVESIIDNKDMKIETRKYASQFQKYLMNKRSELISMLFDFATLLKGDDEYTTDRYSYDLDKLFSDRIDKFLSLAVLYKYLRTEVTQQDKWGNVNIILTHSEIREMFISKEFREFISYEQVNFFLDNEELFEQFL